MANKTLLKAVLAETQPDSWGANCIAALNSSGFNWTSGLVDSRGQAIAQLSERTWGIAVETCYRFCNDDIIPFVRDVLQLQLVCADKLGDLQLPVILGIID